LSHIVKSQNVSDKFRLFFRFSDQKSPRWNEDFIKKQLEIYQKETIAKIYVCGPPLLEEQFDKTLNALAPKFGLDFKT
jgi:predicted ferric reductase